ncbi:PTS mannitol transporter subunit IICBA [Kocuria sp.]|uniref:PTS mannitol transporter subunit IICBA n=1 Tax=Kocuria sp. TaxID=1871328 RepID=UPI0026E090BF|nr:PTS mannitol transporter subunit IICBA [Kocuria sp.]MDO5617355.1 PTS mannitol transporter subunit IICBA [Kocuria sp.]
MTTTTSSQTGAAAGAEKKGGVRVAVQRFGTFLSSMIMPNIAAFIAWGLITALFIPDGFFPNERIETMVGGMVIYLLPLLIAYTGGKLVYDVRGGVVGAIATMGVIMGTSSPVFIGDGPATPMFLGAMIMGPLAAWCMKQLDSLWDGKIKPGFEMLVNNFSAGIFGAIAAIGSMFLLTPVMNLFTNVAGVIVEFLVDNGLLPLTSLIIEPAKVLFLNNAINHGLLTPLGSAQALEQGKSILLLLETNPGPGLGILLAYMVFGRGTARATAPGAAVIHFVGGIHEIYFPYVLMKPQLIIAAIAGGMSGIAVFQIFDVGLASPAAPGSIIAIMLTAASGSHVGIILGVLAATAVSFAVASVILRFSKQTEDDLAEATAKMEGMKGKKSSVSSALTGGAAAAQNTISKIVFACDAGMGSSAMGASVLRNKIKDAGFGNDVSVVNSAINNLRDDFDLVVVHEDLLNRAQTPTPSAMHVSVDNFMGSPRYDEIVELIREQREGSDNSGGAEAAAVPAAAAGATAATSAASGSAGGAGAAPQADPAQASASSSAGEGAAADAGKQILTTDTIRLGATAASRSVAIDQAGDLLVDTGAVDRSYVNAMHERESSVSTFMGNGLAIPHGTNEAKSAIHDSAMSFIRYDQPVDWGGHEVKYVIGIAGADGQHLGLLAKIAKIFSKKESLAQLESAQTPEEILEIFGKVNG